MASLFHVDYVYKSVTYEILILFMSSGDQKILLQECMPVSVGQVSRIFGDLYFGVRYLSYFSISHTNCPTYKFHIGMTLEGVMTGKQFGVELICIKMFYITLRI